MQIFPTPIFWYYYLLLWFSYQLNIVSYVFFFMKTPYILEIHSVKVPIFAYFGIRGQNENSSGDLLLNMSYKKKI